jgi:Asp-tRNA(Asn)/Glu-tRNA(Gln) amidotransferase B subunit
MSYTSEDRYLAWLLGQEMKKSQGKANPREALERLRKEYLEEEQDDR